MNKFLTLTFIFFISSILILAQLPETKSADWQFFTPANEEFSIELPFMPEKEKFAQNDFQRRYYGNFNGTYFFISSDAVRRPEQFNFVMKFVKAFRQTGEKGQNNRTKTEKFVFTDAENFHHAVITAKTKNRVYVFQTIGSVENDSAADRFFANLKISENPSSAQILDSKIADDAADKTAINLSSNPVVALPPPTEGNGFSGSADGMNSDSGKSVAALPAAKRVTAGVKILSKPRANYTDLARFYQITGQNLLKVTFLSNGEIGSVSPVNRLPFGLTEQAILAAKGIRFEPAVRDGAPISVTKIVQYQFSIY